MKRKIVSVPVVPGVLWQAFLLIGPLLLIAGVSFLSRGEYGEIEKPWTLENYKRLAGYDLLGFDPLIPKVLGKSILIALSAAIVCSLLALPIAFFVFRLSGAWKLMALTGLLIPVWTNLLVRTYGWMALLGPDGIVTRAFEVLGLVAAGEGLYPGWGPVFVCLVCDYLPFATLPTYAVVEKLNWSLLDAARDLGANAWHTFRHAVWPQVRAGVGAGFIFVLLPALGQFVVPDLLGGAKTMLLGNLLQQQFGPSRDWPFGSAITLVTMIVVLAGMFLYHRLLKAKGET